MTPDAYDWALITRHFCRPSQAIVVPFHPEKSGHNGLKIYANFLKMAALAC
jgi:imidazoleglycerol phosphate synthase glutamine amidotransferase subunit HisH